MSADLRGRRLTRRAHRGEAEAQGALARERERRGLALPRLVFASTTGIAHVVRVSRAIEYRGRLRVDEGRLRQGYATSGHYLDGCWRLEGVCGAGALHYAADVATLKTVVPWLRLAKPEHCRPAWRHPSAWERWCKLCQRHPELDTAAFLASQQALVQRLGFVEALALEALSLYPSLSKKGSRESA